MIHTLVNLRLWSLDAFLELGGLKQVQYMEWIDHSLILEGLQLRISHHFVVHTEAYEDRT